MKNTSSLSASLRRLALPGAFLTTLLAFGFMSPSGWTQAPAITTSNAALAPLLAKLKTQQDQAAANQTKIEAQTTQLKEEVRQLKIYASRAGSKR